MRDGEDWVGYEEGQIYDSMPDNVIKSRALAKCYFERGNDEKLVMIRLTCRDMYFLKSGFQKRIRI